jgi:hypothetical protein
MTNTKGMDTTKQTAVDFLMDKLFDPSMMVDEQVKWFEQAKEIEGERMRSYIEEKWKQYRIVTNEEDAWLFKEWLIQQTYGGGNK